MLGKAETALKACVDAGLRKLREDGTLAAISTKWYGEDTFKYYAK